MAQVKTRTRDRIRLEERKFAEKFAVSLPKCADKPKAIREASTKLREISLINMLPSIEQVAETFQLPDSIRDQAKDLYRFRSKSLSHPGRPKKQDLEEWLRQGPGIAQHCLADIVARAFFLGYCEHFFRGQSSR